MKNKLKILFLCDFFPPFSKGGGEISVLLQAENLARKNISIIVLAPKYQDKLEFKKSKLKTYWYFFPFKTDKATPYIFLNPLFFIYLFCHIVRVCKNEKINLIHCQGKYSTPSAIIVKYLLKIPLILSLRDYKGICNHGFCLYQSKKACTICTFYKKDFLYYYQNYVKKTHPLAFLKQLVFSFFGRINTIILAFFMKKADKYICVSKFIARIYSNNGYDKSKMITIYNPPPTIDTVNIPQKIQQQIKKHNFIILYAGKLSLGKGAKLLIEAMKNFVKKRKNILLILAGDSYYPVKKIVSGHILYLGRLKHDLLLSIMNKVDLVCIPSLWPEPLSRVTLEAFKIGKPVLSSNVGGQSELINDKNGWLFNPTQKELKKTLSKALSNKKNIKKKGKNAKKFIINFETKQTKKLISIYRKIIK